MTYATGFLLMTAGFILLVWTIVFVVRLKFQEEFGALVRHVDDEVAECAPMEVSFGHDNRTPAFPALGGVDWYELQARAGYEVRQAPDLGGFTEVPLQLRDAQNNWMYMRKRIWMN